MAVGNSSLGSQAQTVVGVIYGTAKVQFNNKQYGTVQVGSSVASCSSMSPQSALSRMSPSTMEPARPMTMKEKTFHIHAMGKWYNHKEREKRERNQAKWKKIRGVFGKPKKVKGYSPIWNAQGVA